MLIDLLTESSSRVISRAPPVGSGLAQSYSNLSSPSCFDAQQPHACASLSPTVCLGLPSHVLFGLASQGNKQVTRAAVEWYGALLRRALILSSTMLSFAPPTGPRIGHVTVV